MKDVWESSFRKDITWFNKPGPKEMAVVHLTVSLIPIITDCKEVSLTLTISTVRQ